MIRPSAVNPKYFFKYIIFGVYFGSFLFHLSFLPGSHFYFPCCSLPTSAFIFLILFAYSLICWYRSRFHLWLLICSHFILSYLLTPGTWSTKYTKVIMKSILLAQGFFLSYRLKFSSPYLYVYPQIDQVPLPKTIQIWLYTPSNLLESHVSVNNTSIYLVNRINPDVTFNSPLTLNLHSQSVVTSNNYNV